MKQGRIANKGDIFWIDPNPIVGREMKDKHRFVIITPKQINALGIVMAIPVTTNGNFSRAQGLTVPILGHDTTGVAICNQIRSFDLEARVAAGSAKYVETLDVMTVNEIIDRVISVIDPMD